MSKNVDYYMRSLSEIERSEIAYRAALSSLSDAREAKAAAMITPMRLHAEMREGVLKSALEKATRLHRQYWQGRLESMVPEVQAAAEVLGRYNRAAYAAGVPGHNPSDVFCIDIASKRFDEQIVREVPIDGPDSSLLGDAMGAWRK